MWKRQYMYKNLLVFLVPLMVPILILGSFSIIITQNVVKDDMNQKNLNLLTQTGDNLELILNEMDTLTLSYQTNPNISVRLKSILNADLLSYEHTLELSLLNNFLGAPANARPFIHSIYVYYDNPSNRMLTSTEGVTSIHDFYDTSWFQSYTKDNPDDSWLEERYINRYNIKSTRVISMYRKLFTIGSSKASGILVMNILPSYIENLLRELTLSPEQTILILDKNHNILFGTNNSQHLSKEDLEQIVISKENQMSIRDSDGQTYAVSHLQSARHELHYISLIPQDVLYRVPKLLFQVTLVLLFVSLLIGILITYGLTNRNYNNLKNIVSFLRAAKQGKPLPLYTAKVTDEYGYILQNMIKTFIEQNYLKTQLSERNYRLRYMEMLALQSQINPHFLYNTLEVIYWKTFGLSGKPSDASIMIEHLSDILKYALGSPQQLVILEKEIHYSQIYLEIQKYRNKDKFNIVWDIEDNVRYFPVLKLILQPLIENSIYHGVKEKKGKSSIKIKVWHMDSYIWIRVIDNGKGMTKKRLETITTMLHKDDSTQPQLYVSDEPSKQSIGLINTNKRLKLYYGDEYGLRILSKRGWGTTVQIIIPLSN